MEPINQSTSGASSAVAQQPTRGVGLAPLSSLQNNNQSSNSGGLHEVSNTNGVEELTGYSGPSGSSVISPSAQVSAPTNTGNFFTDASNFLSNLFGTASSAVSSVVSKIQSNPTVQNVESSIGTGLNIATSALYHTVLSGQSGSIIHAITSSPIINPMVEPTENIIDAIFSAPENAITGIQNSIYSSALNADEGKATTTGNKVVNAVSQQAANLQNIIQPYMTPTVQQGTLEGDLADAWRGVQQGVTQMYFGDTQKVMATFNTPLDKPTTVEGQVAHTVGDVVGQVLSFVAGGEVLKAAGLGKMVMPVLFAALGETSAPSTTTALQRIEEAPVDALTGWLFGGLTAANSTGGALAKAGAAGTILGAQTFINDVIQGMSGTDAAKQAGTMVAVGALFHIAGSATGLISKKLFSSQIKQGVIEMTPQELQHQVFNTDLNKTQTGESLLKLSLDAQNSQKNIRLYVTAQKASPLANVLNLKTPNGISFAAELVDTRTSFANNQAQQGQQTAPTGLTPLSQQPVGESGGEVTPSQQANPIPEEQPNNPQTAVTTQPVVNTPQVQTSPAPVSPVVNTATTEPAEEETENVPTIRVPETLKDDTEKEAFTRLQANPLGARDAYIEKFGNEINPDLALQLFDSYKGTNSASFARVTGAIKDMVYKKELQTEQGKKNNTVVVNAGGSGSGKTSAINKDANLKNTNSIVLDTTFSNNSAPKDIEKALTNNFRVHVNYVLREPTEAWNNGVIPRMLKEGRVITEGYFLKSHVKALDNFLKTYEKYKDNKSVGFTMYANTPEGRHLINIDKLTNTKYDKVALADYIKAATDKAYETGRITKEQHTALTSDRGELERYAAQPERSSESGPQRQVQVLNQEVTDAADLVRDALYQDDMEAATQLHSDFSKEFKSLPAFEDLQREVTTLKDNNLKELDTIEKELTTDKLSGDPDDPTNQLLMIARKMRIFFQSREGSGLLRRGEKTYQSKDGYTMQIGGGAAQTFDKLINDTDIEGFRKNIKVLAHNFDGVFDEIYASIRSGAIDGADYQNFRTYYERLQNERIEQISNNGKDVQNTGVQTDNKSIQNTGDRNPLQNSADTRGQANESTEGSRTTPRNDEVSEGNSSISNQNGLSSSEDAGDQLAERGGNVGRSTESGISQPSGTSRNESLATKSLQAIAKVFNTADDFVTYAIFDHSLNGVELQELEKYEGKTTADKLTNFYNNVTNKVEESRIPGKPGQIEPPVQQRTNTAPKQPPPSETEPQPEGVKVAPVLDQFINEDVLPQAGKVGPWFADLNHEIKSFLSPASLADNKALNLIFTYKGENDLFKFLNREKYRNYTLLGKQVNLMHYWDGISTDKIQQFYDNFEHATEQPTGAWKQLDQLYRQRYDTIYDALSKYKNISKIDNYFKRMWEQNGKSEKDFNEFNRKRGLQGDMSWTKQRFYKFYMDAVKAGKIAKISNPETITQLAEENAARFVNAQIMWEGAKEAGKRTYVPLGKRPPDGFAQIDDRIAQVYLPPPKVSEYFDQQMWDKLHSFMGSLGIANERKLRIGGTRLGYTSPKTDKIVTKFGTPTGVIAHELGHQLDWRYSLQDRFQNPMFQKELRALADKRYEGQDEATQSFKNYVRKGSEKMAVMIDAYVHTPELFQEVAPKTYNALSDFINLHPELQPLNDIKPSLVIGENQTNVNTGGPIMGGRWYAEENLARLINRHLSPDKFSHSIAGRSLQSQKALLNGFELSFSAFHPTFLAIDSLANKFSLLGRQVFSGNVRALPRTFGTTPVALIDYYMQGNAIMRKALAGDPESYAALKAAATAGDKLKAPDGMESTTLDNFNRNIRSGNVLGALFRAPYALIEATMHPLFENIIPRAKLGVFWENYSQALIENADRITAGQTDKQTLARTIWRDVEDRMGELNYENLFWNNSFKGAVQVTMRAPGWFKGTMGTFGGGAKENLQFLGDLTKYFTMHGDKPQFTQRGQYLWSMIFATMAIGGLYQYLHGQGWPTSIEDYFMPKNGTQDANGNDIRIVLPTYFKDAISMMTNPLRYVENKTAPELNLMWEALQNQDFFGNEVRNPTDPLSTQIEQTVGFLLENGLSPFSYQQSAEQPTLQAKLESLSGIMKAPSQYIESDEQKAAQAAYDNQMGPEGPQTPEQEATDQLKAQARNQIQQGGWKNSPAFQQLMQNGTLNTMRKRSDFIKSSYETGTQRLIQHLPRATRTEIENTQ